jgi:hypothetical protein
VWAANAEHDQYAQPAKETLKTHPIIIILHIPIKTLDLESTPGDTLSLEVSYENRRSQ